MAKGSIPVIVLIIVLLAATLGSGFFFLSKNNTLSIPVKVEKKIETATKEKFGKQIKSLHFETSSPAHTETFAASPVNVVINFNFDLAEPSEIKIEKDGKDYGVGGTVIDESKLAMRRGLKPVLEDGIYKVSYKACWPDRSCHDGMFEFEIASATRSTYVNMTRKSEIQINMENIAFDSEKIIVSKGTKVTWINKEPVTHYVNTDPHAGHNHFIFLNSKALSLDNEYSYTFKDSGEYPYHCSAHASSMVGRVLVE